MRLAKKIAAGADFIQTQYCFDVPRLRSYLDQVRDISCSVGLLPRTHGSAVFTRGETQALAVTTLGTVQDELRVLDPLVEEPNRKFMLHYNFPPFSVGEVRPIRGTSRRDIGQ